MNQQDLEKHVRKIELLAIVFIEQKCNRRLVGLELSRFGVVQLTLNRFHSENPILHLI